MTKWSDPIRANGKDCFDRTVETSNRTPRGRIRGFAGAIEKICFNQKRASHVATDDSARVGGGGRIGVGWPVVADPIVGLFNTGVDAAGTPLPDGTIGDPHYSLVNAPGQTTEIRVRTSAGGYPIDSTGEWVGDDSISAWIGPNSDAQLDGPAGTYDYQTSFVLPSDGIVSITGQWTTDNEGVDIELNGSSTGNAISMGNAFQSFHQFSISGAGFAGTNTLDFIVHNDPLMSETNPNNPTGVRVEMTGSFTPEVPEPSRLVGLLGLGGIGLMIGFVWRRWLAA